MNDKKHAKAIPLAHRGCFDKGPENTMPAFEEAVQCGMGGLEIDIRSGGRNWIPWEWMLLKPTPERCGRNSKQVIHYRE